MRSRQPSRRTHARYVSEGGGQRSNRRMGQPPHGKLLRTETSYLVQPDSTDVLELSRCVWTLCAHVPSTELETGCTDVPTNDRVHAGEPGDESKLPRGSARMRASLEPAHIRRHP